MTERKKNRNATMDKPVVVPRFKAYDEQNPADHRARAKRIREARRYKEMTRGMAA